MPHSISERKGESVNGSQAKQTESRWHIELPAWCPGAPRDGLWAVFIREESGDQAPHPHPLFLCHPGAFLVCWLPFFLTHVLITHCKTCHVSPALYRATTWLGYVNSALNPVIYTTFNVEFRKAFLKILSCWGRRRGRTHFTHFQMPGRLDPCPPGSAWNDYTVFWRVWYEDSWSRTALVRNNQLFIPQ